MPSQIESGDLAGTPFRVGEWFVEPSLNRLSRGETTIQLELKVMDVLVCLAERAGEVLTRQEIVDRVWATEFISDNTLTHAVTELRNALGDDARNPSFIETIHRRGYRLIASIEPVFSDGPGESRVARFPVRERLATADEERSPYPGLAAFTEDEAEFFFGREDEVAKMWRKLTSRRLLAVIGPSGVGKSSFLRAGVMPARPTGWGVLYCQPGEAPFASLARSLVPEFEGDPEAISRLVHLEGSGEAVAMFSRWRQQHDQVLLIVDQFEELFALSPQETQATFADLLRQVVDEADVHVLLSMRDDFLHRCHAHDPLRPIFEDLSALEQPGGDALRRALVEPARQLGFELEDDELAADMVVEVAGERGALPMLAFAVARLWDKRDRESRTLTRQAYAEIGGVGGALARHAENTLRSIGDAGQPIVREIFRNLVTSQGTRAVRSVDDLMTVFPESRRGDARQVLAKLIDSRLLTSFEEEAVEGDGHHRVEVAHESLLSSWPRLVRWQTQDADAAQLRDQLRQAAKTWDDHDRTRDFLWTGKAYREFSVWRENYPGGLTEIEEDFGASMTAHAKRRKRRRRIAVAAAFVVLLAVLTVIGSFWRQSEREALRAEAAELVALGQLELESYPSATVAHAIASLELSDSRAARLLALEALWEGPTVFVVSEQPTLEVGFTSDGRWLTQRFFAPGEGPIRLIGEDGSIRPLPETDGQGGFSRSHAGARNDLFVLRDLDLDRQSGAMITKRVRLWSASECSVIAEAPYDQRVLGASVIPDERRVLVFVSEGQGRLSVDTLSFDGDLSRLGALDFEIEADGGSWHGSWDAHEARIIATSTGHDIFVTGIEDAGLSRPRLLGTENATVASLAVDPQGRFVASATVNGDVRLWPLTGGPPTDRVPGPPEARVFFTEDGEFLFCRRWASANGNPTHDEHQFWIWAVESDGLTFLRSTDVGLPAPKSFLNVDGDGRRFVRTGGDQVIRLWRRAAPADAEPVELLRGGVLQVYMPEFHPDGRWLAVADSSGLGLWPLARPYPIVLRQHTNAVSNVLFAPDGNWLASASSDGTAKLWPLDGVAPEPGREVLDPAEFAFFSGLATDSVGGRLLIGGGPYRGIDLVPLDGDPRSTLQFSESCSQYLDLAASRDGRFAAATCSDWDPEFRKIDVWDMNLGERIAELAKGASKSFSQPFFAGGKSMLALDETGVRLWDIESQTSSLIHAGRFQKFVASQTGKKALLLEAPAEEESGRAVVVDLERGESTVLETHGDQVWSLALDAAGTIAVTGDMDGTVRVGPVTGEKPHVLSGHDGTVKDLAIDPRGRWIASGGYDTTVRLWPMPDLSKPPLHTLPHDELIAKLKTLTNLRVVRDGESATGWKLTHDPFPGWETVPEW